MQKSKFKPLHTHYRAYDKDQYELLRRRAFDEAGDSVQQVIDKWNFPFGWEAELQQRRENHRVAGVKDSRFFPSRDSDVKNSKVKPGRRPVTPLPQGRSVYA